MEVTQIREHKIVRLDSVLFNKLWKKGGYSLIAVYSELKAFRNRPERYIPIFHPSNNKTSSGYSLLKMCTGISMNTLKKTVPQLIELNLGYFDVTGGFFLHGNNKTRLSARKKMVPIKIGKNFTNTRLSAKFVIVSSNLRRQEILWKRKETLRELFKVEAFQQRTLNKKEREIVKRAHLDGITLSNMNMVKKSILSNRKLYELVNGYQNKNEDSWKGSGNYLKKRFRSVGWISTRRRFKDLFGRYVPFQEYLTWKAAAGKAGERISWRKGRVVLELCNEITDLLQRISCFSKFQESLQTCR